MTLARLACSVVGAAALGLGVPALLAILVALVHPERIALVTHHEVFPFLVGTDLALGCAATGAYLAAGLLEVPRLTRVTVRLLGLALFTMPAASLIVFAPTVCAFVDELGQRL